MRFNKKQKGLMYGIIFWMLLRIVYLPLVGSKSLLDMSELIKTVGVMLFGIILIYLIKDKKT